MVRLRWLRRPCFDRLAKLRGLAAAVRLGLLAATALACGDDRGLPPEALPYRLEASVAPDWPTVPADLDADGIDELIVTYEPSKHPVRPSLQAVQIRRHTGETLGQTNFPGTVVGISVLDTDRDDQPEALVSFIRNDSLFATAIDRSSRRRFSLFLARGRPRVEPEGMLPWDPVIVSFEMADADGDGAVDLISVVNTGYARLPRGVLIHRLPSGELVDQLIIGAPPNQAVISDFDDDGIPEIALVSWAVDNGASAGGLDDRHGYFVVLGLRPARVVYARELGGVGTAAQLASGDFDGDGAPELLLVVLSRGDESASVELLEPGTWRVRRRRDFPRAFNWSVAADIDRDTRPEILLTQLDSVVMLNGNLEVVGRRRLQDRYATVEAVEDMDDDGIPEILVVEAQRAWLVGPDLSVRARLDAGDRFTRPLAARRWSAVVGRGPHEQPELLLHPGGKPATYRLVRNRLWALHRWGMQAFWVVAALTLAAGAFALLHFRRRALRLAELNLVALDDDADGLLRVRADGRIVWINRTLEGWLGGGTRPADAAVDALETAAPALASFCDRLLHTDRPRHVQDDGPLPGATGRHAAYLAEPLAPGRSGAAEWLVRVRDVTELRELQEARTWTLLAQRVAHDVKNPLTSLLLTLQRMMMEYQARAPELAADLDPYAERMQQRINQLRSMTTNFMKFVDADAPEQRDVPLNEFLESAAERISRTLPADIRLAVRLGAESPVVCIDPQQFESVLENLVGNAVNAMPDGGTITFATGVDRGIRLLTGHDAADWARLEVLDTGGGIPGDALELIFDPGFSATESGSGLGLTIVRRIVERHGGRIYVESEPGMGAVFSIHLPLVDCGPLQPDGDGNPETATTSNGNSEA